MAKRGIYVKQNINRRHVYLAVLFCLFFVFFCSYIERQKLICQNKLCLILLLLGNLLYIILKTFLNKWLLQKVLFGNKVTVSAVISKAKANQKSILFCHPPALIC